MSDDFFAGFDTQSFAVDVLALCPPKVREELARLVARLTDFEAEVARLRVQVQRVEIENATFKRHTEQAAAARDAALARAEAAERDALDKGHRIPVILAQHDEATSRATVAEDFIRHRGYRRCDIAACNCKSWHGGHSEARLQEIEDELSKAGVEWRGTILATVQAALLRWEECSILRLEAERALAAEREAHAETRKQVR